MYVSECGTSKLAEARRRDVISHFLLRLACSMSVDLTQRFITRELDLFKIRSNIESPSLLQFLVYNKIKPDEVSETELAEFRTQLMNGNQIGEDKIDTTKFYKLRFTECRELIRNRKVFLHKGYCYVTVSDFIQFLVQRLRLILSTSMNVSYHFKSVIAF